MKTFISAVLTGFVLMVQSFHSYAGVHVDNLKTLRFEVTEGYTVSSLYQNYRVLRMIPIGKFDNSGACVGKVTFLQLFAARNNMTCTDEAFRNLGYGPNHIWFAPVVTQADLDSGISLKPDSNSIVTTEAVTAFEQAILERGYADVNKEVSALIKETRILLAGLSSRIAEKIRKGLASIEADANASIMALKKGYEDRIAVLHYVLWVAGIFTLVIGIALVAVVFLKNGAEKRAVELQNELGELEKEAAVVRLNHSKKNEAYLLFFMKYGVMFELPDDMETRDGESSIYLLLDPSNRARIHVPGYEDAVNKLNFLARLRSKENLRKLVGVQFKETRQSNLQAVSS